MPKPLAFLLFFLVLSLGAAYLYLSTPPVDPGYTSSEDYYPDSYVVDFDNLEDDLSYNGSPSLENIGITPALLQDYQEIHPGVFYQNTGNQVIIRTKLDDPRVRFFVGHPDTLETVCAQMDRFGLQLAVNGSGFYANSGIVDPFGMTEGEIFSTSQRPGITVAITEEDKLSFIQPGQQLSRNTRYAVTGFNRVVNDGKISDRFYPSDPDYKSGYGTVRPRTTLSTDGEYLTIVLFQSPITVTGAGEYILKNFPGTTDVFNMDGGGSTNGCDDKLGPIVPETGRPVADIFGIYSH